MWIASACALCHNLQVLDVVIFSASAACIVGVLSMRIRSKPANVEANLCSARANIETKPRPLNRASIALLGAGAVLTLVWLALLAWLLIDLVHLVV
jgi:hypothetical protein